MTVLTGIIYPLFVTIVGQTAFANRANGSMIVVNNKLVGSELIGQKFAGNQYFNGRPSATDYNPIPSGGSNLSVTSKELQLHVKQNTVVFDSVNYLSSLQIIPSEMLYASGSGLDPHISLNAAMLQVNRICQARHLPETAANQIFNLISQLKENRQLGFLGEERVNVLKLNLELDKLFSRQL